MTRRSIHRVAAILITYGLTGSVAAAAPSEDRTAVPPVTAFPSPGDEFAIPTTRLTFRGADADSVGNATVVGSHSGVHDGSTRTLPQGRGAIFEPDTPFAPGETVTVDIGTAVRGDADGHYSFRVATPSSMHRVPSNVATLPHWGLSSGVCAPPTPSYKSRPDLRPIGACTTLDTKRSAPGYLFGASEGPGGVTIYDNNGAVIWHKPEILAQNLQVITVDGKKRLAYFTGAYLGRFVVDRGVYVVLDEHYREVGRIEAGNGYQVGQHELQVTPTGTALIGSYTPVLMTVENRPLIVLDYVVQEIDFQNDGAVLFEWHALDHVPVTQSYTPLPERFGIFDYFHGNSIDFTPDGNLLISARNTWGVYKVSRNDGHVMWTLGMPRDGAGSFGRTLSGSNLGWFCYQHDARQEEDGTITLFDNGSGDPDPGCGHPARAMAIRVNPAVRTATVVKSLRHQPDVATQFLGSNMPMANGNRLVSWGNAKRITEFDPAGAPTLEMSFGQFYYRVYRSEWRGLPLSPPQAVIDRSRVYVSWNGSTEVSKWQLLGGSAPDALRPIGRPVVKRGFETSIAIPSGTSEIAVQALDANGNPLARGRAIASSREQARTSDFSVTDKILGLVRTYLTLDFRLWLVLGVTLALAGAFAVVCLFRRDPLTKIIGGSIGLTIAAAVASATGPQEFYLLGLLLSAISLAVYLVANLIKRPLIGVIVGLVAGWGTVWRQERPLLRAFLRTGWIWVGFLTLKLVVQLWAYFTGDLLTITLTRFILDWPLWLLAIWATYVVVKRSMGYGRWSHVRTAARGEANERGPLEPADSTATVSRNQGQLSSAEYSKEGSL